MRDEGNDYDSEIKKLEEEYSTNLITIIDYDMRKKEILSKYQKNPFDIKKLIGQTWEANVMGVMKFMLEFKFIKDISSKLYEGQAAFSMMGVTVNDSKFNMELLESSKDRKLFNLDLKGPNFDFKFMIEFLIDETINLIYSTKGPDIRTTIGGNDMGVSVIKKSHFIKTEYRGDQHGLDYINELVIKLEEAQMKYVTQEDKEKAFLQIMEEVGNKHLIDTIQLHQSQNPEIQRLCKIVDGIFLKNNRN
eukprot:TRINITY_DN4760_c0_g1_i1.p1 TRINITY_DN4760_c0_g1~~TRINITY_DN4760_c0_g1_i1.p1  ORF type:complete len:248 (-),score=81.77 TRINITY_DN4760_c0_g1_i1:35-778(-)